VDPAQLDDIAGRHGILLLLQFGSAATGTLRPDSDLDLAVLLERPPDSLHQTAELIADLQALAPEREVDLAVINHADPLFLKQILDRYVLLYGSRRRLHELEMFAFRRYQDHRRYLRMEREYLARRLQGVTAS